jgi:hypothetical protein
VEQEIQKSRKKNSKIQEQKLQKSGKQNYKNRGIFFSKIKEQK